MEKSGHMTLRKDSKVADDYRQVYCITSRQGGSLVRACNSDHMQREEEDDDDDDANLPREKIR